MNRRIILCSIVGLVLLTLSGAAQEAAVVETAAEQVTLWQLWLTGGWAMYPLGLLSVAALGLAIFGFVQYREQKMMHLELLPDLRDAIGRLDLQQADNLCQNVPSVMTNVFHAGLQRVDLDDYDSQAVEKAMEEAAVEENTAGLKPINYLSIIATIAPMFGLLGTVSGMIKAFQKIGLGGMGDPERLASDIGEAMVTTAFGLLIGIPAMFFYFFLKSRFHSSVSRIGRELGTLQHELDRAARKYQRGALQPSTTAPAAQPEQEGA